MIFYTADFLNLCCVYLSFICAVYASLYLHVCPFIVLLYNAIECVYRNRRVII